MAVRDAVGESIVKLNVGIMLVFRFGTILKSRIPEVETVFSR